MTLSPGNWSIVLIGWWNPAILSPAGIIKYIFKIPEKENIHVSVPLDGVSSYTVTNPKGNLDVHVEKERLQIDIKKYDFASLGEGMQAALNALNSLPVTPIKAVGFNLNYNAPESCEELIAITDSPIDNEISDKGLIISGRSFSRTISFEEGQINFTISKQVDKFHVNFNFHLGTSDAEKAKKWLQTPVESIKESVKKIGNVFKIEIEEIQNDGSNVS